MNTHIISEPGFAAETAALLKRIGSQAALSDYESLLEARAAPSGPDLAGRQDPAVHAADVHLPLRDGPVLARLYRKLPATRPRPVLLWLHGGGFIGGSVYDIDHVCSRLAHLAEITVVSLDYRLAPEHPYPSALHDTYDAIRWLADHGALIGGDGRVAVGGQSAGASLAAGACLLTRDEGGPAVTHQVLCYPVLDFGQDTESFRKFNGVFLNIEPGGWAETQYLAGKPITPYAAPLRSDSLAGLPPALIIGAGNDPLRDDARTYAARLDTENVDVTYAEYADTMHAFLNFCGVLSAGPHAIKQIATELKQKLAT